MSGFLCQFKGCLAPAGWYPVVILPPKGLYDAAEPARMSARLKVCDACRERVRVEDIIMTGDQRRAIEKQFRRMGKVKPDFRKARLEFEPIAGGDHPWKDEEGDGDA